MPAFSASVYGTTSNASANARAMIRSAPSKNPAHFWNSTKTSFEQLVKIMLDADMAKVAVERAGDEIRMNLAEYLEKGIVK